MIESPRNACSILILSSVFFSIFDFAKLQAEAIRLDPTRDTWLSAVGDEAKGANGGASRLKFKSIQELSLIDFPFEQLRGNRINKCWLYLKQSSDVPLDRLTVSTIGTEWIEGKGTNYEVANGQSTFSHRRYPDERWSDTDITSVALGAGSTRWKSLKPEQLADGWYRYDVPVELIDPCIARLSPGWLIMDDTGSTWTRDGETFKYNLFPNRFAFSRDSNHASMPYLEVDFEQRTKVDRITPPTDFAWKQPETSLADPRPMLSWHWQSNSKNEGLKTNELVGFRLRANGKEVPQHLMPSIAKPSRDKFSMPIDMLFTTWKLDEEQRLELSAVDREGVESDPTILKVPAIARKDIKIPFSRRDESSGNQARAAGPVHSDIDWSACLALGSMRIAIIDPLDQVLSDKNQIVPANRQDYLANNLLWDAKTRAITLHSSRGAWSGIQLAIHDPTASIRAKLQIPKLNGFRAEWYRYEYVRRAQSLLADPLVPIATQANEDAALVLTTSKLSPNHGSWLIEFYLPPEAIAGEYRASLKLESTEGACELPIRIQVADFVVPSRLSFLPEMNCYDLPANAIDYYRLGNRHRVVLNRVPYFQNGLVADGLAPLGKPGIGEPGKWDWGAWDQRWQGLFDGSAFSDLPRGKIPIECFYLPMHENWPLEMKDNYNGSYWADEAFPDSYRSAWEQTVFDFINHIEKHGWDQTRFHVFMNNKVDFKSRGWSRGSSPWLLDEPANFQDFAALQFFGQLTRRAFDRSTKRSRVVYRCDVSRPQWQRDTLDGLLEYNVVSHSALSDYRRMVLDRKMRGDQTVVAYGSANPIGTNNIQSVAWAWDTWSHGGDGILPWQTIGKAADWQTANDEAVFYPNPDGNQGPPLPSIRLKAYCYAQQDIETLIALWQRMNQKQSIDRFEFGEQVLQALRIKSTEVSSSENDAGWGSYGAVTPESFERLRRGLLKVISQSK